MSQRIVIDPITRIEGHLRIEAELDDNTDDHQSLFFRNHGPRHGNHPQGPRPARSLGVRPARLRRLHHRPLVLPRSARSRTPWGSRFPRRPTSSAT